jgi:UDP-N-acetylglucosamine 2-epimerase (non-hydrolysing)
MTRRVHLVAGARPNFMKVAPLYHELKNAAWCRPVIVHAGQHYSANMSDVFFDDLGLPLPDHHLGVGSGSHAEQAGSAMIAYEKLCLAEPPDWVVVVGDVNSTLACALAAKKLALPVAHLEAGLRSFDRTMPEEINRVATDAISDLLWTPSPDGDANLLKEGVSPDRIERVGNIMIDAFVMMLPRIEAEDVAGVAHGDYGIVTLHRPSNVDEALDLAPIVDALCQVQCTLKLIFPAHPRTSQALQRHGLKDRLIGAGVELVEPMGYVKFMALVRRARLVITDSGGVQEETSYLGIPCLTLRTTTERPITISQGTNRLVDTVSLPAAARAALGQSPTRPRAIDLWDGHTAGRVADSLRRHMGNEVTR